MRRVLRAAICLAAAVVAGCGGSDLDSGVDSYPGAVDATCRDAAKLFAEQQADAPSTFEQGTSMMDGLVEIADNEQAALLAAQPPAPRAKAYRRYLVAHTDAVALIHDGLGAARARDGEAYAQARAELRQTASRRFRLARAAGLSDCSRTASAGKSG